MTINILYNMDCVEGMIMRMPFEIDLVVTDPPYGLSSGLETLEEKKEKGNDTYWTSKGDWDTFETEKEFIDFTESWLSACYKKLRHGGQIYIFATHHNLFITYGLLKNIGYTFRQLLIWYSPSSPPCMTNNRVYQHCCEYILWATKGNNYTFNNTKIYKQPMTKQIKDIFLINSLFPGNPERISGHPTQKPVELLKKLIGVSSNEGDVVMDCFLGSGSTMLACIQSNRHCFGFEVNGEYINLIKKKVKWNQSPNQYFLVDNPEKIDEDKVNDLIKKYDGLINRQQAIEMI